MDSIFPRKLRQYLTKPKKIVSETVEPSPELVDQEVEESESVVERVQYYRLPPTIADNLFQTRLLLIALTALSMVNAIGLVGVAFKQTPDLVFSEDGDAYRVYPFGKDENAEIQRIEKYVGETVPTLLTFSNLKPNKKDPTGFTFVPDTFKEVVMADDSRQKLPSSNWNRQYSFSEGSRIPNMRFIADIYKQVEQDIQIRNSGTLLSQATIYRFAFKTLPGYPDVRVRKEVSPGVWEVVFTGEIIKESPELNKILPSDMPRDKKELFRTFSIRTLVSRAPVVPKTLESGEQQDLMYEGKKNGYEMGLLVPYNPQNEALPRR
jgi:hypothetical protein